MNFIASNYEADAGSGVGGVAAGGAAGVPEEGNGGGVGDGAIWEKLK